MTTAPLRTAPATASVPPARRAASAGQAPRPASPGRVGLRSLVLDAAIPVGLYYILRAAGADLFVALAASSALPLARTIYDVARGRAVSGLALLVLAVNAVSLGISFWSGNPRFMLAKDGAITSVIGAGVLISVVAGRPLMTAGMRPFVTRGHAAREAAFDRLLATSDRFGRLNRIFNVVWGIAFLAECAARVTVAFTLPVGTVVWLSTVLSVGFIGAACLVGGFFADPMEKMVRAAVQAGTATATETETATAR